MSLSHTLLLKVLALPQVGSKRAMQLATELMAQNLHDISDHDLYEFAYHFFQGKTEISSVQERNAWPSIAVSILNQSAQLDITVISYFDEQYPEILKRISDAPVILYAKGNLQTLQEKPSLAVIGTRTPTDWGYRSGERISQSLADAGINIVSGLAKGCDMAGHHGALKVHGSTTAVLAHGLQGIYPSENQSMAENIIAAGGLLLSEYPVGTEPHKGYFVRRDRLQAGLSLGTLVIETGLEGGSIHTMEYTLKYGRQLFCLSHPTSLREMPEVQGNQYYLQQKKARAIRNKQDVE